METSLFSPQISNVDLDDGFGHVFTIKVVVEGRSFDLGGNIFFEEGWVGATTSARFHNSSLGMVIPPHLTASSQWNPQITICGIIYNHWSCTRLGQESFLKKNIELKKLLWSL